MKFNIVPGGHDPPLKRNTRGGIITVAEVGDLGRDCGEYEPGSATPATTKKKHPRDFSRGCLNFDELSKEPVKAGS